MIKIIVTLIHIVNLVTIFYMVFKEKRSANSIVAWSLVLYIAPLVGFVIFLLIGRKLNKNNMFGIKQMEYETYKTYLEQNKISNHLEHINKNNKDIIESIEKMSYSPYKEKNNIDLFTDSKDFFDELLHSLSLAQKSINIEFYIFKNDEIGMKILKLLEKKAREGIAVRLLYDSVGSRALNRKVLKEFIDAGGMIGEFFPSWLKIINLNMNFRNHRKIVVIDNKIGFVGGFNIGDEYLGKSHKFGYWRDTHIKFKGDAVKDLNLRFLADWKYATKENIDLENALMKTIDFNEEGNDAIQIVSSGPNLSDTFEIKFGYLKMIQKARKYIYIQSPYLIIDNSISDSLKLAALSGVDVKIMIPGKGDHPFVFWANIFYAGDLLESGVKVYHYDKNAFLHAKTVVIDDEICSIGTANMDTRSFELNFEVNAFIYSNEISRKQKSAFENDLLKSEELTLERYNNRSKIVKLKEGISKLFSSIL